MTKRIICILMMLTFVSQGCLAQDILLDNIEAESHIPLGGVLFEEGEVLEVEEAPFSFFSTLPFDEYIAEFVLSNEELPEMISGLSSYGITKDEFSYKYFDAVLKHPELLIKTEYNYCWVIEGTDIIEAVKPEYLVETKAEADIARAQMDAAVKEYTDLAAEYDTDLEKLLVIHDKMVADCDYDVNVLSKDADVVASVDKTIYHALGVLRDNFAVCQGYSQALYMIAKELDIELDLCRSAKINHMWNYVKLDGEWYHMDMTNDDPPEIDADGNTVARDDKRAWHRYFMVSDSGLIADAHGTDYGTMTGERYTCNSTKYESDYLFNMNGTVFTAQRNENGYFTVNVVITGPSGTPITIPFISKSLYTGPMVTSPARIEVPQVTTENGEEITKNVTNLYLAQYTTRNIPSVMPFIKTDDGIAVYPAQEECERDCFNMVQIAKDVENNPVEKFTAYFFENETLIPWSLAKEWTLQQN